MGAERLRIVKEVSSILDIDLMSASKWVNDIPMMIIIDNDEMKMVDKLSPLFKCIVYETDDVDIIRDYRLKKLGL